MKPNISGATYSSILSAGQRLKELSEKTGQEYLYLNRGVNSVASIKLQKIFQNIDFDSLENQAYLPNLGLYSLRTKIAQQYFANPFKADNVIITPGGMPALDLVLQSVSYSKIYVPFFHWGSYNKLAQIRNKEIESYRSLEEPIDKNSLVIVCDPSNPTGLYTDTNTLVRQIKKLSSKGVIVLVDCPYRRLFEQDSFFEEISNCDNVIIAESFSKSLGLSGYRLGFVYTANKEVLQEMSIRSLYAYNSVSILPQLIIDKLLIEPEIIKEYQETTVKAIRENIEYLGDQNLLCHGDVYTETVKGIFCIVPFSEELLLKYKIGSVGLIKFVLEKDKEEIYRGLSRICLSVLPEKFKAFFQPMLEEIVV